MLDGEPGDSSAEPLRSTTSGSKRPSTPPSKKTDSAPKSKRLRVSRACDQCRAGREKCDGAQPSCQTCEAQDRACSYNEQPKKRGIQPNYIRTLELTLAWIFEKHPESERTLSQTLPDAAGSAHRLIAWKDASASETLHSAWRNSIVCRQIDQLLSGANVELPWASQPARRQHDAPYQSPPLSAPSDNSIPYDAILDVLSPPGPANGASGLNPASSPASSTLKLPNNSWALLEHYFAFTQTWMPIIERHDILKLMYTYPAAGLPQSDASGSGHAELWSIMAIAALQLGGAPNDVDSCRDIARSLIPQEHGFQLGHIKALLILGLLDLMKEARVSAWLTIGSAVRLLTHFNLGKGTNTTLFEGRTKHTLLAAFVLEHSVASQTGAITHIRSDDIRELGFLIEDGLEEWAPWQDPSASSSTGSAKLPSKSISTFNECLRVALRQDLRQHGAPVSVANGTGDAISELLRNASNLGRRSHPSTVIQNHRAREATTVLPDTGDNFATPGSTAMHARDNSSNLDFMNNFMDHPFMAIPNETSPANNLPLATTPAMWTGEGPSQHAMDTDVSTSAAAAGDIFEELAMLERTDSTANPKFMQNLGFGPDLDLAEFFGADYQPSDLSYSDEGLAKNAE